MFSNQNNPKILVLGLNGLIGWSLFCAAKKYGAVYGTYRKNHVMLPLDACERIDMLDASALSRLFKKIKPDYIVHAWAICDLDVCEEHPAIAHRVNVEGTEAVLKAASEIKELTKFIYISTDHVFGGTSGLYSEMDPPDPMHVYGRTKAQAEKRVEASGLPWMIIRPGLIIGESLQGTKGPRDFLLNRILLGKPTHYFIDEYRSPIKSSDFSEAAMRLALSEKQGHFHVAGKTVYNRFSLARWIAQDSRLPLNRIYPRLRGDDRWAHIRPEKLTLTSTMLSLIDSFPTI